MDNILFYFKPVYFRRKGKWQLYAGYQFFSRPDILDGFPGLFSRHGYFVLTNQKSASSHIYYLLFKTAVRLYRPSDRQAGTNRLHECQEKCRDITRYSANRIFQ